LSFHTQAHKFPFCIVINSPLFLSFAFFKVSGIPFLDPTTANTVRRRQKDGTLKDVPCPSVATAYNKFMFGVDRADQIRMQYSTCRKALNGGNTYSGSVPT
jgi:hypothetical protein